MQGFHITSYGRPMRPLELRPLTLGETGPGEVRIRIGAFAVNPVDAKTRRGESKLLLPVRPPFIPGVDLAGTVDAVGADVRGLSVEDKIMSYTGMDRMGAYADAIMLPADRVAPAPAAVPMEVAASLPLAALCAWQAIEATQARPGASLLVLGGAGTVGKMVVQLAVLRGLEVCVTSSPTDASLVQSIGAHRLIDYRAQTLPADLRGLDAVIDTVGGKALTQAWPVLRPGGTMVSLHVPPPSADLKEAGLRAGWLIRTLLPLASRTAYRAARRAGVTLAPLLTRPNAHQLREIAPLVDAGILRPPAVRIVSSTAMLSGADPQTSHTRTRMVVTTTS